MIKLFFLQILNFNSEKIQLIVDNPTQEKVLLEKLSPTEYNWYFYFKYKHHLHLVNIYQEIFPHNNYYFFTKDIKIYHLKKENQHNCPINIENLSYKKYAHYINNFKNY